MAEAAVAVVGGRWSAGAHCRDQSIAEWLRGQKVPVLLAVKQV